MAAKSDSRTIRSDSSEAGRGSEPARLDRPSTQTSRPRKHAYTREQLNTFKELPAFKKLPKALTTDDFRELQKYPHQEERPTPAMTRPSSGPAPGFGPPKEAWRALQVPVRPPGLPAAGTAAPMPVRSRLVDDSSAAGSPADGRGPQQSTPPAAQPPRPGVEPPNSWRKPAPGSWRREDESLSPTGPAGRQGREERWAQDSWRGGHGGEKRVSGPGSERANRAGPPMAQTRWEDAPPAPGGPYENNRRPSTKEASGSFLSKDRDVAGRESDWRARNGAARGPEVPADGRSMRGAPAWMADGESLPLEDGEARPVDAASHDSQQARMREEIEAERLSYRQKAHFSAPSAAATPQKHVQACLTDEEFATMNMDETEDLNGLSLLASDPESSPDRPPASHPPPGLVAPPVPPRADVVTSSAATKDLQAAFGFDDSDSEDSPAKPDSAPAQAALPKLESVLATSAKAPAEQAERMPTAVEQPTRDADSPVPVQRRFHWMQLEPSPTRPEPKAAPNQFGAPTLTLEHTRLSDQQLPQQHHALLPLERQSPRHGPHISMQPTPKEQQDLVDRAGTTRTDQPAPLAAAQVPPDVPHASASHSEQAGASSASVPPLQGLQENAADGPASEPLAFPGEQSLPTLTLSTANGSSRPASALDQRSSGPSRPPSALSDLHGGNTGSQTALNPSADRPAPALDAEASWPPAIDVNPPAWSATPSLGLGLFNSMLPQLGGFNGGQLAGFAAFANAPPALGHAPPSTLLEQQRSASLGQHQAILDTLNRAQGNAPSQQPAPGDRAQQLPGRPSEQLLQGEAAPAENSLLALLQGSIRSLQAGSGGAIAGNSSAAPGHALPGTEGSSMRATLDSAFAAAAGTPQRPGSALDSAAGQFAQAGSLSSMHLPASGSAASSGLLPPQLPAQATNLPNTSRNPSWNGMQLPAGMTPNLAPQQAQNHDQVRLMALRQQLLQQQAQQQAQQAHQQQRSMAGAGGGLPFTGAQMGTARLPAGSLGARLGGGLDGSSVPLSHLLNAQNLPLRKDMAQSPHLGQSAQGFQGVGLQQYARNLQQQAQAQQQHANLRGAAGPQMPRISAQLGAPEHAHLNGAFAGAYQQQQQQQQQLPPVGGTRDNLQALLQRAAASQMQHQQQQPQQALPAGWGGLVADPTNLAHMRMHQGGIDAALLKQQQEQQQQQRLHALRVQQLQQAQLAARAAQSHAQFGGANLPSHQPQLGGHMQSTLGQDTGQYGLGLNRPLYSQGFGGAIQGLPQGLDPTRGIDQFFPQPAAGSGGGLSNLQSTGGLLPMQGRHGHMQ